MSYDVQSPFYVGFAGQAGSGKTYTAKRLIPDQTFMYEDKEKFPPFMWQHYWFSAPLYEMATVKNLLQGPESMDRKLYQLHAIIDELIGQRISYDDLYELVYDIYAMPIETEGKPRTFLTSAGDRCKQAYFDCFANHVKYKVLHDFLTIKADVDRNEANLPYYTGIVSDVRLVNEAEMIKSNPNSLLIKFEASEDVRNQRLLDRDGKTLDSTQRQHNSETGLELIPEEMFDYVIDTDGITLDEQARRVYTIIAEHIPLPELQKAA